MVHSSSPGLPFLSLRLYAQLWLCVAVGHLSDGISEPRTLGHLVATSLAEQSWGHSRRVREYSPVCLFHDVYTTSLYQSFHNSTLLASRELLTSVTSNAGDIELCATLGAFGESHLPAVSFNDAGDNLQAEPSTVCQRRVA